MRLLTAGERFNSSYGGVESWHCFSAGAHYDGSNLSFGALIGCDEHVLAPGGGFARHAHRGVAIVTWVLSGALRHEDGRGRVLVVEPGSVLVQRTGQGIEHSEVNASSDVSCRFVQLTLFDDGVDCTVDLTMPPVVVGDARFDVWRSDAELNSARWHAFVASGAWQVQAGAATLELDAGDSVRGHDQVSAQGSGELLVLAWLSDVVPVE